MGKIDSSEVTTFNALYEALGDFNTALDCLETADYIFYKNKTM